MEADAITIKQKGLLDYPIAWSWSQNEAVICDYAILMQAFGGKFVDDNGKPAFQTGGGLDALKFMVQSLKGRRHQPALDRIPRGRRARRVLQRQGGLRLNWTYMYNLANNDPKESQVNGQVGVMPPPGVAGISTISTVNGAMGLGIPTGSKNKDAAWSYIQFLASPAIEAKYAASSPPIWKSYFVDALKANPPDAQLISTEDQSFKALFNRPQVVNYQQFSARLQLAIQTGAARQGDAGGRTERGSRRPQQVGPRGKDLTGFGVPFAIAASAPGAGGTGGAYRLAVA